MSRPFRTLSALSLLALSLGLFGCETIYRPIYTNRRNYFKPQERLAKAGGSTKTAEEILKETDARNNPPPSANPLDPGAAMPPPAPLTPDAAMPGMTPPAVPPPAN